MATTHLRAKVAFFCRGVNHSLQIFTFNSFRKIRSKTSLFPHFSIRGILSATPAACHSLHQFGLYTPNRISFSSPDLVRRVRYKSSSPIVSYQMGNSFFTVHAAVFGWQAQDVALGWLEDVQEPRVCEAVLLVLILRIHKPFSNTWGKMSLGNRRTYLVRSSQLPAPHIVCPSLPHQ